MCIVIFVRGAGVGFVTFIKIINSTEKLIEFAKIEWREIVLNFNFFYERLPTTKAPHYAKNSENSDSFANKTKENFIKERLNTVLEKIHLENPICQFGLLDI